MFWSTPTIRRFTPPTCTLEIKSTQYPLYTWTQRETLKNLRFKLSFDDPRVAEEEQITIQGDRVQLEELSQVVIDYVQNFLRQSFQVNNFISRPCSTAEQLYLQPQGLVSHQLFLGFLANKNSPPQIQLSAVQLFDLVTALEEYNSHIIALPQLNRERQKRILPLWGSVAAGTVLVVGLTSVGVKLSQNQETSVADSNRTPSRVMPQLEEVTPPQVSATKENSTPKPKLTEPLSSTKKLPPPPPVDLPKPAPDIPDPAQYSPSEVAKKPGFVDPNANQTESTIAVAPKLQSKSQADVTPKLDSEDVAEETDKIMTNKSPQYSNPAKKTTLQEAPRLKQEQSSQRENSSSREPMEINNPSLDIQLGDETNLNIGLNNSLITTSQLQEVNQYFQEKWQPPAELSQSLQYRLILNTDGTIARVVPIGKISETYLERTNIPLKGESFISPLIENQSRIIRLLLTPDGEAIAFSE